MAEAAEWDASTFFSGNVEGYKSSIPGRIPVSYFRTIWAIYLRRILLCTREETTLVRFVLTIRRLDLSRGFVILAE